jgi:multidrug resistance efflux pump
VPLVSPIDGVVLTREVSLGQAVQAASDAFQVANLSALWVVLDLFEKDLSHVHKEQKVTAANGGLSRQDLPRPRRVCRSSDR